MPLTANNRLGPYEIKSRLGVGGMGEVYRARDSRLNRDVAIKVLREDGGPNADHRGRFEREARAVAALNHPNIVAVYDFGMEAGQQYIVSELIEGESLRVLATGKPLATRKLLDLAAQIADGLAAAHAAGIVHRDLKPENIMLGKDGRVKILDFGLARYAPCVPAAMPGSDETGAVEIGADETRAIEGAAHITREGAVMGTACYMSPEQAMGLEVDYRSDQFSFALVLYELASGKQAFSRASTVETMAAIVREEPPPIDARLPAPLKWIIDRCLQKEPSQRYESTRDLARDLKDVRDHSSESHISGAVVPMLAQSRGRLWITAAIFAAAMVCMALALYLLKPASQRLEDYRYTPIAVSAKNPVWSPDAKAVAYSVKVNGTYQLFLRYLNSPVPIQLTHGNDNIDAVGWSSDREHILVLASVDRATLGFKLESVAIVGGEPEYLMNTDCARCDLSRSGSAFAAFIRVKAGGYTLAVSDPVGTPMRAYPFTTNSPQDLNFSPDGTKLVAIMTDPKGGNQTWLLPYPALQGSAHQLPYQLQWQSAGQYGAELSWMPDNRHLVMSRTAGAGGIRPHLWLVDTKSQAETQLTTGTEFEWTPVVSPDGKSLLYMQTRATADAISLSVADGSADTLISTGYVELYPQWSAQTGKLVWTSNREGRFDVWVRLRDGTERPVVTDSDFALPNGQIYAPVLSPDGERLIFARHDSQGKEHLWISTLSGGQPVRLTNDENSYEEGGSWSPDGSRFAYIAFDEKGFSLMLTRTSGGAKPVFLKAAESINFPDWSPDGSWMTHRDKQGWELLSLDGKSTKPLGKFTARSLVFSKDGKSLYGIRDGVAGSDPATLFCLDIATLKQKAIRQLGPDLTPASAYLYRLSLSPDGKSVTYAVHKEQSDLWMLEGFNPTGWLEQIRRLWR